MTLAKKGADGNFWIFCEEYFSIRILYKLLLILPLNPRKILFFFLKGVSRMLEIPKVICHILCHLRRHSHNVRRTMSSFSVLASSNIFRLVGCGLTSHSAIFQLYSDWTVVQFSNFDLLPGTQRHGQLGVLRVPNLPRHGHRDVQWRL